MENLLILRFELFIFIVSFWYSTFYIWDYILKLILKVKVFLSFVKKKEDNQPLKIINVDKETNNKVSIKKTYDSTQKKLSEDEKTKIAEIIKRVKVNSEKWYYDIARSLIIEWLTIDKYNKELNMELASMYEKEKNYKNAELIYRDMSLVHSDNTVILAKLGYIIAMQWNYKESIIFYEQVHERNKWDSDTIEILANLNYELFNFENSLKYIKLALKDKPKNIEFLKMKAFCLEKTLKQKDSIKVYEEILQSKPYDTYCIDNIRRLEQNIINNIK